MSPAKAGLPVISALASQGSESTRRGPEDVARQGGLKQEDRANLALIGLVHPLLGDQSPRRLALQRWQKNGRTVGQ